MTGTMAEKKKPVCMLCGKPSGKSICDACAQRVQGEHTDRKIKERKPKQ
ncbi:MAG TPA: hypothetical protein VNN18_10025 [Candidatus Xenobia bacterium]|nr:hypothetical protein [Candidatus Xenobia bacterium]